MPPTHSSPGFEAPPSDYKNRGILLCAGDDHFVPAELTPATLGKRPSSQKRWLSARRERPIRAFGFGPDVVADDER